MQSLEPLSYFFGAFLGDGSAVTDICYHRIVIVCQDKDIVERCYFDVTYYFTDLRRARLFESTTRAGTILYGVRWNGTEFFNLVKQAVGNKEYFPNYIWNASREAKLDMLAGLMDTDGTIGVMRVLSTHSVYFTGGKPFVKYFPYLCESLGIKVGSIRSDDRGNRNSCFSFRLRKESLRKSGFRFYCRRKQERLDNWLNGADNAVQRSEYRQLNRQG